MVNILKTVWLLFVLVLFTQGVSKACTSAVVVADKSSEGVPMLWKHRDSSSWDCHVAYVQGAKYGYTAIVSKDGKLTYSGINEKGFAILNTVSQNMLLVEDMAVSHGDGALLAMGVALGECATVEEFEAMLVETNGKRSFVTNFAVGDPSGAVAYFEVSQSSFKRYNTSKREVGFDIRSNFSFSGNMAKPGPSIPRYDVVMHQMWSKRVHTPYDFINYSRSYVNRRGESVIELPEKFVCNDQTVPRYKSAAAMVAICDGENPRMLVFVGHPASGMAVPVYVKAKSAIPECVTGRLALNLSEEFRAKAYKSVEEGRYELNKSVVSAVLGVRAECKIPRKMPANIEKFNAAIDARFARYAEEVRGVLSQF